MQAVQMLRDAEGTSEHEVLGCTIYEEIARLPTGAALLAESSNVTTEQLHSFAGIAQCMLDNKLSLSGTCSSVSQAIEDGVWLKLDGLLLSAAEILVSRGVRVTRDISSDKARYKKEKTSESSVWTGAAIVSATLAVLAGISLLVGVVGLAVHNRRHSHIVQFERSI